jgi:hypothetical protein
MVSKFNMAAGSSFVCALIASVFTLWQIKNHLLRNKNPKLRKYTVRILGMVPIYAITSWLGMVCKNYAPGIAVFRDCYESLVLYSFYQFLIVALGGKTKLGDMLAFKPQVMHLWPCSALMRPWPMGNRFLQLCAVGILQYIPCKIICAFAAVISESFGLYGNGQYTNYKVAYPWITLILNCSQMWALYCLALIYLGTKEELASIKPVAKFASIKLIIFFTWWQVQSINSTVYQ